VGYEVVNLGGGNQPISLNTIIEKLETLLGKKAQIKNAPFHIADIKTTWADISKADRLFGWKPTIDLDSGLKACVDWHRENLPWSSQIVLP
jgi:nucleoside-diphosphate-sugar epimerase